MTARKTPAQPVANLRQARKEQAAAKAAHPAGKKVAPAAKPATAKVADKKVYAATGRGGKVRRSASATVLTHAVDVKISGRKDEAFARGVVVAFYSDVKAAEKAAAKINAGGGDWSDAVVVPAKAVSA